MKIKNLKFYILFVTVLTLLSCKKEDPILTKLKNVDVVTTEQQKLSLYDYIKAKQSEKPIILINYKIRHSSTKKLIESMANDSVFNSKYTIIALNTDQNTNNLYDNSLVGDSNFNQFVKLNKNLINKGIIKYNLIFNPSGNYHNVFFDGWAASNQILLIKNNQVIYQNLIGEYYPKSFEKKLVESVIQSENKIIQAEFSSDNVKMSYSFNNYLRTGNWKAEYIKSNRKNKLFSIGNFDNGQYSSYFLGELQIQSTYKNGVLNGEYKEFEVNYNGNGNLKKLGNYKNGKKEGVWKRFSYKGALATEINYKNDEKEGLFKRYFDNGKISITGNYLKNKETGEWKYFYKNDSIKIITNYLEGKKQGVFKYYFENGKLKHLGNFNNGNRIGLWESYFENGIKRATFNYDENGKLNGNFIKFYQNSKTGKKGNYLKGKEDGNWEIHWENGQLYQLVNFKKGNFSDILSCYDEQGNSLEKGSLANGNGTINNYTKEGKLLSTSTFVNGKIKGFQSEKDKKEAYFNTIEKTKTPIKTPEKQHNIISYTKYSINKYGKLWDNNYIISVPFTIPETGEVLLFLDGTIESRYTLIANNKKYPLFLFNEYNIRNKFDFKISGKDFYAPNGKEFITQTTNDILIDDLRGKRCYLVYTLSIKDYKKYAYSRSLGFGFYVFENRQKLEEFNQYLKKLDTKK